MVFIIYTALFIFQEVLPVEKAIDSNSPMGSGKLDLEEEGINQKIKYKGLLLMEKNSNDSNENSKTPKLNL